MSFGGVGASYKGTTFKIANSLQSEALPVRFF